MFYLLPGAQITSTQLFTLSVFWLLSEQGLKQSRELEASHRLTLQQVFHQELCSFQLRLKVSLLEEEGFSF